MHDFYTITELTKEFGVSTRTLRFYEDEGLIHPLRRGRTRLFRQSDRQLLRNIRDNCAVRGDDETNHQRRR